jgi:signal transduction histidine kinase
LHLSFRDDGSGFNLNPETGAFAQQDRYGILGMQERARLNDGHLKITSEAGTCSTITLELTRIERSSTV